MRRIAVILFVLGVAASPAMSAHPSFLLDRSLWASSENAEVAPGPVVKPPANPLFGEEFPWEPRFDNMYPNVLWDADEGIYKCWYNLFVVFQVDPKTATKERLTWTRRESGLAYAISRDGIHWHKPLMADFPFDGHPSNVLLRGAHGVGVFKDAHEPDPKKRYKVVLRREVNGEGVAFSWAYSADGIHWSALQDIPNIRLKADTHNNALWAPTLGRYVLFTRDWGPPEGRMDGHVASGIANGRDRVRLSARSESADFVSWTDPRIVLRGEDNWHQVYAMPVFYYEGIYLGLPVILDVRADRARTELAWSRDTVHWERIAPGHPFIGNGESPGSYDWGCAYAAESPVVRGAGDDIRVYYGASDNTHTGPRRTHLAFATLRPEGFAGAKAADLSHPASITTVPQSGGVHHGLSLTADVEPGGFVQAVLVDPATGHELGRTARWEGPRRATGERMTWQTRPSPQAGPVQVRFLFSRAMLYSFRFGAP